MLAVSVSILVRAHSLCATQQPTRLWQTHGTTLCIQ
jgi:hypothetical protein